MNQSNSILAKRIAYLESQLSSTKNLLESSMLSEATAKQYAEEVDKQNKELAAQVEALHSHRHDLLDLIYNCAIGQVSMGYAVDAESLAQSAYSITGIDATSNRKLTEPESPQQHLAEVRAQAVLEFATDAIAIFGEYLDVQVTSGRGTDAVDIEITHVIESLKLKECANQYADSIRQGVK